MGWHLPGGFEKFQALDFLLRDGEQPGRELLEKINAELLVATETRKAMARWKLSCLLTMSGPVFYAMMAEMESDGEVRGWYKSKVVDDALVRERWYRITEGGMRTRDDRPVDAAEPDFRLGWA